MNEASLTFRCVISTPPPSCSGLAYVFACAFSKNVAMLTAVTIPIVLGGLLNGVTLPLKTAGPFMYWVVLPLSYARWGNEALVLMELRDGMNGTFAERIYDQITTSTAYNLDMGITNSMIALFVQGAVLRIVAYFCLVCIDRKKQK